MLNKILSTVTLVLLVNIAFSQSTNKGDKDIKNTEALPPVSVANSNTSDTSRRAAMPKFPSGFAGLRNYISTHLEYPDEAINENISGDVLVGFTVCEDGSLCDFDIKRSPSPILSEEALRIVK